MAEVMTVAEGRVAKSRADAFEEAYRAVRNSELTPGLRMSFLVRNAADAELYRIITVWESREALERMRSSPQVPKAVALFRDAGIEPQVFIFEIRENVP